VRQRAGSVLSGSGGADLPTARGPGAPVSRGSRWGRRALLAP